MKNTINYDNVMQDLLATSKGKSILLHTCCAPCLTYPLSVLHNILKVSVFFYNPNITDKKEYQKRLSELRFYLEKNAPDVNIIEANYNTQDFYDVISGLENQKEGGARCFECYELRLSKTAQQAKSMHFDYFSTVLSVSPYKNSAAINRIGAELEKVFDVNFLYADFKKRNGFQIGAKMSALNNLYRQDYCGCEFSNRKV